MIKFVWLKLKFKDFKLPSTPPPPLPFLNSKYRLEKCLLVQEKTTQDDPFTDPKS